MDLNQLTLKVQLLSYDLEQLKVAVTTPHTIWDSPLFSGFVGALTVFVFNIIYNYFRDIRDKRFQCRSFISAEEIDNLGTRLEGYNYELTEDIRLVETKSLIKLDERIKAGEISDVRGNFLKIENLGPSLVTNVIINMEIEGKLSKHKVILRKVIPVIPTKQKIFILAHTLEIPIEPQLLRKASITYITIAGERMKYSYEVTGEFSIIKNNLICKEKYFFKRFGIYKNISISETKPISWIFIKHKREVT